MGRGTATPTGKRSPTGATLVMDAAWMRAIFRQRGAWSARDRSVKNVHPNARFFFFYARSSRRPGQSRLRAFSTRLHSPNQRLFTIYLNKIVSLCPALLFSWSANKIVKLINTTNDDSSITPGLTSATLSAPIP